MNNTTRHQIDRDDLDQNSCDHANYDHASCNQKSCDQKSFDLKSVEHAEHVEHVKRTESAESAESAEHVGRAERVERVENEKRVDGYAVEVDRAPDRASSPAAKADRESEHTIDVYLCDGTSQDIRDRYRSLVALARESDFGALEDVVVLDTETTGVSLNHDELTQVAAARLEHGEITEWFVTFVNPSRPIPEEITHLTNIYDEDVADAPTPEEAIAKLVDFVGASDVVAHNCEFDKHFITRVPAGEPLLENAWIDSLDLTRIALPRLRSHRLLDLVHAFDAPISTHRADADVEALCAVYRILLAAVASMPQSLLEKIASFSDESMWQTAKVFRYFVENPTAITTTSVPEQAPAFEQAPAPASAPQPEQAHASASKSEPFSLMKLRSARVKALERKPKRDADEIAADPTRNLQFPTAEEIREAFSEGGLVGSLYEVFEPRSEQLEMAEAVHEAFGCSSNLAVEAGTGVGKSMAYLVPAVLTAGKNGITVGVATKTNALLDQLVYKELPLLCDAYERRSGYHFDFTSLKGFSHYLCLRKVEALLRSGPQTREVMGKSYYQAPSLAALLSYIEQSDYHDIDALKMDYRAIPRGLVTTSSNDCLRRKCPFFGSACFVHGARRRAEAADIVVTNHSLLFCDVAAEGGLLPPIRYWIIDEAHGVEAEARRAFSLEVSAEEITRIASRVSSDDASRNVFLRLGRRFAQAASQITELAAAGTPLAATAAADEEGSVTKKASAESSSESATEDPSTLLYALTSKAQSAGKNYALAATEFAAHMKDLLYFDAGSKTKGYEFVDLWINDQVRGSSVFEELRSFGRLFIDAAEKLIKASQDLAAHLDDINSISEFDSLDGAAEHNSNASNNSVGGTAELQREIASLATKLKDITQAAELILFSAPHEYAYAAKLSKKKDHAAESLLALMLDVGEKMNESLYARSHSVVFTSATITTQGSFAAFEKALGLNTSEFSQTALIELPSSYDFDHQMTIYVADDVPEPNDPSYLAALQRLLVSTHLAQQGSLLTLFTNRKEMETCFDAVQPLLKAEGLRLVCQKWGLSVKSLRDDFLLDEHLSLFALKSFWEGFDAPGATLKGVIIPKLPFARPTDPLSCERAERDAKAWSHYVLPAAIIETKQAAGRLIRKASDRGSLILADRRLLTKNYGKAFLDSLPSKTVKICSTEEIARCLEVEVSRRG